MKISTADACTFLECAEPKLMQLLREGHIPGLKLGQSWVIPREAFFQVVNQMSIDSGAAILLAAREEAHRQLMAVKQQAPPAGRNRAYRSS